MWQGGMSPGQLKFPLIVSGAVKSRTEKPLTMGYLSSSGEEQFTVCMCVHLWTAYSVPLFHLSVLWQILHSLDDCSLELDF